MSPVFFPGQGVGYLISVWLIDILNLMLLKSIISERQDDTENNIYMAISLVKSLTNLFLFLSSDILQVSN